MSIDPIEPGTPSPAGEAAAPAAPSKPAGRGGKPGGAPGGKANAKSGRRRAREFALQGLYQWLVSGGEPAAIDSHVRELEEFAKCDSQLFDALLHGCITEAAALDAALARHVDRRTEQLSPVEHGVLLIGTYELAHSLDVPYRVVINEAVEVAKAFGGTDGHKYVNGVLDKVAADLRSVEVGNARAQRGARPRG